MNRSKLLGLILGATAFSLLARADTARILVEVDKETISTDNLKSTAEGLGARGTMMVSNPTLRRQLVNQMVDNRLIAREAAAKGLEKTPDYERMLGEARVNILANLYQRKFVVDGLTDARLQAFFKENQKQFAAKKIHASHIQVKDEAVAKTVLALALKPGADFAALAKQYSAAPGASKGGDLGWFGRGRMLPEFEDAAYACPKGEVCPRTVKTPFGWHVIKVHDVQGGDEVAYETVKEPVRQAYERKLKEDLLQQLRAKAKVAVHEDVLRDFKM